MSLMSAQITRVISSPSISTSGVLTGIFAMAFSLASSESISDISADEQLQDASSPLACDAYHHYYHYQSSAQYLWLATTLRVLGRTNEAIVAYNNAIFQDHFN